MRFVCKQTQKGHSKDVELACHSQEKTTACSPSSSKTLVLSASPFPSHVCYSLLLCGWQSFFPFRPRKMSRPKSRTNLPCSNRRSKFSLVLSFAITIMSARLLDARTVILGRTLRGFELRTLQPPTAQHREVKRRTELQTQLLTLQQENARLKDSGVKFEVHPRSSSDVTDSNVSFRQTTTPTTTLKLVKTCSFDMIVPPVTTMRLDAPDFGAHPSVSDIIIGCTTVLRTKRNRFTDCESAYAAAFRKYFVARRRNKKSDEGEKKKASEFDKHGQQSKCVLLEKVSPCRMGQG